MMKDVLVLNDGTKIQLETGASLSVLEVLCENLEEFNEIFLKLTPENLSKVVITNGDRIIIGRFYDLLFVDATVSNKDDLIHVFLNLREMTDFEKKFKQLEEMQKVLEDSVSENTEAILDTQNGLVETYEQTEENTKDIVDLGNALVEVYEELSGE